MTQTPKQNSDAAAGGVLKNFAIFTEKNLCWSLFLQSCKPSELHRY